MPHAFADTQESSTSTRRQQGPESSEDCSTSNDDDNAAESRPSSWGSIVYHPQSALEERAVNSIDYSKMFVVKLCDLGLATRADSRFGVEDGDPRYLAPELLREDFSDLTKADIFSLAVTIYELANGRPLAKQGPHWDGIRNNQVVYLQGYSTKFMDLLKCMMQSDHIMRPSAKMLLSHDVFDDKLKFLLRRERNVNAYLRAQLTQALRFFSNYRGGMGRMERSFDMRKPADRR